MDEPISANSLFGPDSAEVAETPSEEGREFSRIWQGFMIARFTVGLLLVALQITLFASGISHGKWQIVVSLAYLASTVRTGMFGTPRMLDDTFNRPWLRLVGLDLLTFFTLQLLQGSNLNYTPLYALPVLLVSVLGSRRLALGTAAGISMLLLTSAFLVYPAPDTTYAQVQEALSGVGYFAMALLGNQLATRLARAGHQARRNQVAVRMQRQINSLVIETLPDGVLIVDREGAVRAANPAATELLACKEADIHVVKHLGTSPAWAPLLRLTRFSLESGSVQEADINIRHIGHGARRIRVRSRPTDSQEIGGEKLCVLFLQDQRELEARIRTEKLASMGRMSTAVAHEIRNPLAAIAQANALLDEDLTDPRQKRLTRMVSDNALRLSRIVDDILNASRVQPVQAGALVPTIPLNALTLRVCTEWARQVQCEEQLRVRLANTDMTVQFDSEHLRRVLINLLDNARRFTSGRLGGIQVITEADADGTDRLCVWSDGPPMDPSVEQHLFEPFFSSGSRSSGLGLYICRELCQGHAALISYRRNRRQRETEGTDAIDGNEFQIAFERANRSTIGQTSSSSAIAP